MIVWTLSQITIQNYLTLISIVIVYYDHLLTLDEEQRFIWRRWNTTGSWLFFINRYFALLSTSSWLGSFLPWETVESCNQYSFYRQMAAGLTEFIVTSNMFLRVYALYGRSTRIAVFAVTLFAALVGVCGWQLNGQESLTVIVDGCHIALSSGTRLAVAWEGLLALDILIFFLTFFKTYTAVRKPQPTVQPGSLLNLMLRDGAMYYVILTCANLANITTFYLAPPMLMGCLSSVTSSISMTMLSRMMLNLHKRAEVSRTLVALTDGELSPSTVKFVAMRPSFEQEDFDGSVDGGGSIVGTIDSEETSVGISALASFDTGDGGSADSGKLV